MVQKRIVRSRHDNGFTYIDFLKEDGTTETSTTLEHAKIHKSLQGVLMGYGMMQITHGRYLNGAPTAAKVAATQKVIDSLYSGTWRPGYRAKIAAVPTIILALAEVLAKQRGSEQDIKQIAAEYNAKSKSDKMKVAKHPDIIVARDAISAARARERVKKVKKQPVEPLAF